MSIKFVQLMFDREDNYIRGVMSSILLHLHYGNPDAALDQCRNLAIHCFAEADSIYKWSDQFACADQKPEYLEYAKLLAFCGDIIEDMYWRIKEEVKA